MSIIDGIIELHKRYGDVTLIDVMHKLTVEERIRRREAFG
jgi:hypothetical protein